MRMHNPPHPGEIIRKLCLEPLDLSVTDAAAALGISRKTLSALLNGRAGISPEMAVRLSIAFGTSSESWMNQQMQYDLWHAEKRRKDLRYPAWLPDCAYPLAQAEHQRHVTRARSTVRGTFSPTRPWCRLTVRWSGP
jgi:antitoxin HigA-1